MIKFRIVPVVKTVGIHFIVERKSFLFWKTCKEKQSSNYGTVYSTYYFSSIKDAVDYIEKFYGKYSRIEHYRC